MNCCSSVDEQQFTILRQRPHIVVHNLLKLIDGLTQREQTFGNLVVSKSLLVLILNGVGGLALAPVDELVLDDADDVFGDVLTNDMEWEIERTEE